VPWQGATPTGKLGDGRVDRPVGRRVDATATACHPVLRADARQVPAAVAPVAVPPDKARRQVAEAAAGVRPAPQEPPLSRALREAEADSGTSEGARRLWGQAAVVAALQEVLQPPDVHDAQSAWIASQDVQRGMKVCGRPCTHACVHA
jgi:hypothetical protein